MNLERLDELETIDPRPLPPWRAESFAEIEIGSDRETARERAETVGSRSAIVVYSDASEREGHLGAAIAVLDNNLEVIESQQIQVGPMDRWSVHVAELIGIFYAISTVFKISYQRLRTEGQRIIHTILQAATEVQAKGTALRLQWIPGHCDNPGNDAADRLAKDAASPGKTYPFRPLLTRKKAIIRDNIRAQWERE
ncbi:hypothetical protein CBS147333_9647 [Penicillium roqueforti]|nr:hypothetical protein CBS147333_9647 [Penicillium roqueforti]KAI3261819.1 hypothetical protein CBS147308_9607 [Penicillium roqueforti]KAI3279569.1 hypothetical protein DTO003C3_9681 [Penicillium roqueforti]